MSKHTSGPWIVDHEDDDYITQQNVAEDISIAQILPIDKGGPKGFHRGSETDANARLIAAAPDLLEALIDIADDYEERFDMESPSTNPSMKMVVQAARAAIAKARGDA